MPKQFVGDPALQRRDRSSQRIGNHGHLSGQVYALQFNLHGRLYRSLLFGREIGQSFSMLRARDIVFGQSGEPDQSLRGVILPEIRPHAVEAAVIHQVGLLKTGLASLDVGSGHQVSALGSDEPIGERRRRLVGQHGRPAEEAESHDRHGQQQPFQDIADRIVSPLSGYCWFHRYRIPRFEFARPAPWSGRLKMYILYILFATTPSYFWGPWPVLRSLVDADKPRLCFWTCV